ncbi:MAG: hypothetical protein GY726_01725 [Proteobacteria bacterium]|nr:hypothetical protein [Pseudomonadota bacterium]
MSAQFDSEYLSVVPKAQLCVATSTGQFILLEIVRKCPEHALNKLFSENGIL